MSFGNGHIDESAVIAAQNFGYAAQQIGQNMYAQKLINEVAAERDAIIAKLAKDRDAWKAQAKKIDEGAAKAITQLVEERDQWRNEAERRKLSAYKYRVATAAFTETVKELASAGDIEIEKAREILAKKTAEENQKDSYSDFACPTEGGILDKITAT